MSGVSTRSAFFVCTILTYLIIGTLFAIYTPAWQVPDEPAHYNYIRYLAEQGRFPVLQNGDFPLDYLQQIVSGGFPPELSIDPLRYEFHQPPLYYLLAVPIFNLFDGALLPLRLISVALGAGLVYAAFRISLAVCPARSELALGTAALAAFVPMHVAMTAAVNNDTLAELLLALALWGLVRYLQSREGENKILAAVGLLLGLGLLTKIYALIGVAAAVVAVIHRRRREPRRAARDLAWLLGPVLFLAAPWLARNVAVYGWPDVTGLARHDQVVLGQPTTAEWIADFGWGYVLQEGLRMTYRSFWGVFGWMGVFMNGRIYQALGLFALLAGLGLLRQAVSWSRARYQPWRSVPALLLLVGALTLLSFLWYNTKFVQHQGRYLFPALIPLGLAVSLGWQNVAIWSSRVITKIKNPNHIALLLYGLPFAALAVLDMVCLIAFIIPFLN